MRIPQNKAKSRKMFNATVNKSKKLNGFALKKRGGIKL